MSSLDPALKDSSAKLRDFLVNGMNLTEDEAISLITVDGDFAITQVVDGNWASIQLNDWVTLIKLIALDTLWLYIDALRL
jgi:acetamidase/formamidase